MATRTKAKAESNGAAHGGSWSDDPARAAKSAEHLEAMEAAAAAEAKAAKNAIVLPRLDIRFIKLRIIGDAPLICHRWGEKAIKMMLDKQMGTASAGREKKDPEQDFRDSLYVHPEGGYGFPVIAFKNAAVDACTSLGKTITKTAARQAFHLVGELARIEGEPRPREDMVRLNGQTADVRYRGEFPEWSTELVIRFNARVLSDKQVINLFNVAGFAVGVGEWRPEKNGMYGLFHVG